MKTLEVAFFALCAILTLGGGLVTVGSRRPIRSAMGLLATIAGICGCYLLLAAEFLAAVQLIVYAGAVVILFIFVIMLLGSAATSPPDAGSAVPRYLGASVFLIGGVSALVWVIKTATDSDYTVAKLAADFGTVDSMGREIFTGKIVPFELSGALLLVAAVGALAVARGKHGDPTRKPAEPQKGTES